MAAAGGVVSFVGRETEVGALVAAIDTARRGQGQVVLIEGEPGIGKSRLIDAAIDHAIAAGFTARLGACSDLGARRPFAALADALAARDDATDAHSRTIAALLDRYIPADGESAAVPASPGLQYRLTEAFGALVEKAAARGPVLLALDDLQWADPSTLSALRSIARRLKPLPVALIGAFRSGHTVGDLHRVADDLLRDGAHHVVVGPLDERSVESLAAAVLTGTPDPATLIRARGAGGNPLFVIEFVRSVAGSGDSEGPATPLQFRLTVQRRIGSLPERTRNLLQLAALLGTTFSPRDLGTLAAASALDVASALQPAFENTILEERDVEVAFRHGLVREAVYEHIPIALRRELHRHAAESLAAAHAPALTVAHHLSLAANGPDAEAVAWLRRAARETAPKSPGDAAELLERAIALLPPASAARPDVRAELAVALAWSGRLAEAEALGQEVLLGRPGPTVAGTLRCGLVYALTWQGRANDAIRHAVVDDDEHLRQEDAVLLRALAAVARMWRFDLRNAATDAAAAAADAERLGHDLALCHALTVQAWVATFAFRPHDAVALALRAVEVADQSQTGAPHLAHPRFFPGLPLLFLDELEEAERILGEGLRVAEDLGLAWSLPLYHALLGAKGFICGDWDGAIAECEAATSAADEVSLHVGIIAAVSAWLATILVHRDDVAGAEQVLAAALGRLAETGPQMGMGPFHHARALVLDARNQPEEALQVLQTAWDAFLVGAPQQNDADEALNMTDPWSAMAMVRLCVQSGQRERAAALLPSIDRQSAATGTPFMQGQSLRCRALVEQDADLMVKAVALYRQCPRPHELAAACEDTALLLADSALERAVPYWNEALEHYEALGATRDVARVRAQLRQRGVKRGTRRPHTRATSGWESITATEKRVIALVSEGLSNPEVAERLYISRHTVESHLKHVYRKLNLSSRVELVKVAGEHLTSI